jgi:outer membrane receptor protein involved in Fe transport
LEDSVAARNISNIVDPVSPTGRTRTIVRSGRNSGLQPQTAETLSAGLDWAPAFLPGFRSELSYFAVDYTDRVTTPSNPNTVQLRDPAWANTVTLRGEIPDAQFDALVVDILTGPGNRVNGCNPPTTTSVCSESPGNIMAIMDRRLTNISGSRTRGLDLNLSQHIDSGLGSWRLGANASYLLENSRRVSSFSPYASILNRVFNPVDLRVRASLRWSRSGWSVSSFVNYTDNYDNEGGALIGTLPPADIDSWTTLDLGISYDGSAQVSGWLSGLRVALHGSNVTDEDPPFYDDGSFGLGYDPANANPMGRVLSLTVSKTW